MLYFFCLFWIFFVHLFADWVTVITNRFFFYTQICKIPVFFNTVHSQINVTNNIQNLIPKIIQMIYQSNNLFSNVEFLTLSKFYLFLFGKVNNFF